ncbi:DUF262 domain-containing protein [Micrococcus luteus]|uniref:DUF262 domain-containing protein n=2 Tax=Actinomycetes TaxID=1760 RepID=UPI0033195E8B
MENPEPRAQYLNVVLRHIDRTALRIPRFQRHFVWGERDVLELLESIKKGYPIGSVLTWRVNKKAEYFSGYRTATFPEPAEDLESFEVILDGAQRLSSLYGCLKNPDSDPVYQVHYDTRQEKFFHSSMEADLQPWNVPMSSLFDSRGFLSVQANMAPLPDGEEILPRALDLYSTFQDYQIPIITLSNAELPDVVEVFRRVNSSGTPLSSVDFVRALTWQSRFDLEETFRSIIEEFQGTSLEGLSDELLIRFLAIAAGIPLGARDVLELQGLSKRPGGLSNEVSEMRSALSQMAILLSDLGIRSLSDIPYEAQRVILFSLVYFNSPVDGTSIERWIWTSTFAEEHQSKPESYFNRLVRDIRDGDTDQALRVDKHVDPHLFATRPRRANAAVTAGFDLLLRRRGARSLISGQPVDPAVGTLVPIFTKEEIKKPDPGSKGTPLLLANLALLHVDELQQWKNFVLEQGVRALYERCQAQMVDAEEVWETQGISSNMMKGAGGDGMEISPGEFLRQRSELLLRGTGAIA